MKVTFNHTDDCSDVFYEDGAQKPALKVYDPDVLAELERIEKESSIFDIVDELLAAQEEASANDAEAQEAWREKSVLEDEVDELKYKIDELEVTIEDLEQEVKDLKAKIPKPAPTFPTQGEILEMIARRNSSLDNPGWCIRCGEEVDGCEPGACRHLCEICGENSVYTPEELFLRRPM